MKLPPRFSIGWLMIVVLAVSVCLAALRSRSQTSAGWVYLTTYGILMLAIVGAVCRRASERAWWLGFALCGLGYMRWTFGDVDGIPRPPTNTLLDHLGLHDFPGFCSPDFQGIIGNCFWSLVAATVGGTLAHALFGGSVGPSAERDPGPQQEVGPARARWRRFAALGLVGLVTITVLVLVAPRSDPALWAGAVYLLTWGLLGLAVLGFACGRGQRRMIWLGAALFGLGYMVLNRGPDRPQEYSYLHPVADQFLIALRPWLPSVVSGLPAETARIGVENSRVKKALDQPVPMTFPDAVPLEDLLKYVRTATQAPDGHEIVIYVDPIGLEATGKTMQSPIQIDIEGHPLSLTLRLALRQLGMHFDVRDGMLFIASDSPFFTSDNLEDDRDVVDYYLLLGNCVLALLAAGLGAWLVPLVADPRTRQSD